jgi:hypothetical protein
MLPAMRVLPLVSRKRHARYVEQRLPNRLRESHNGPAAPETQGAASETSLTSK